MQLSNIWPSWKGAHFCDSHGQAWGKVGTWEAGCQSLFCQTLALRKLLWIWTRPFNGKVCVDLRGWYYINSRTHMDLFHKSGLRKNKSTLELIHCNLKISVMFRHFLVNKTLPGNPAPRIQLFLGNLFDGKASRQRRQLRTGAPADRKKNLGWKTRPQCGCYNTCTHPPALEATCKILQALGDIAERAKWKCDDKSHSKINPRLWTLRKRKKRALTRCLLRILSSSSKSESDRILSQHLDHHDHKNADCQLDNNDVPLSEVMRALTKTRGLYERWLAAGEESRQVL